MYRLPIGCEVIKLSSSNNNQAVIHENKYFAFTLFEKSQFFHTIQENSLSFVCLKEGAQQPLLKRLWAEKEFLTFSF